MILGLLLCGLLREFHGGFHSRWVSDSVYNNIKTLQGHHFQWWLLRVRESVDNELYTEGERGE